MVVDAGYSVRSDKPTLAVVAAWLVVMVGTLVHVMTRPFDWSLDLRVYRNGGGAWLQDLPIYVDHFGSSMGGPDLPFTYPPIAVVLFSPLAAVPLPAAIFIIALLNLAALTALCLIAAVRVCGRGPLAIRYGLGAAVVSSVFDPVRETLYSSLKMTKQALVALGLTPEQAVDRVERFRRQDAELIKAQYLVYDDETKLVQTTREALADLERLFEADASPEAERARERDAGTPLTGEE